MVQSRDSRSRRPRDAILRGRFGIFEAWAYAHAEVVWVCGVVRVFVFAVERLYLRNVASASSQQHSFGVGFLLSILGTVFLFLGALTTFACACFIVDHGRRYDDDRGRFSCSSLCHRNGRFAHWDRFLDWGTCGFAFLGAHPIKRVLNVVDQFFKQVKMVSYHSLYWSLQSADILVACQDVQACPGGRDYLIPCLDRSHIRGSVCSQ